MPAVWNYYKFLEKKEEEVREDEGKNNCNDGGAGDMRNWIYSERINQPVLVPSVGPKISTNLQLVDVRRRNYCHRVLMHKKGGLDFEFQNNPNYILHYVMRSTLRVMRRGLVAMNRK